MGKMVEEFRRQLGILRRLPFKKKIAHIWQYYRFHICVFLAAVILLVSVTQLLISNQKEILISGFLVNNDTTQEGYAHLTQEYWEYCGGDRHQKVELVPYRAIHFDEGDLSQENAANILMLSIMISDGGLDYIIADRQVLLYLEAQEMVLDLGSLLSSQELSQLDTLSEDGRILGIRLDDTGFAKEYPFAKEDVFLLVPSTIPSRERVVRFLTYLLF